MDRRSFLKQTAGLAASLAFAGCATSGNDVPKTANFRKTGNNKRGYPTNHIHGYDPKNVDQNDVKHKLDVLAFGKQLYFGNNVGWHKPTEQLGFVLFKYQDTEKIIDLDSKEVVLKPKQAYIPTLVRDDDGNPIDELALEIYGPHGRQTGITTMRDLDLSRRMKRSEYLGTATLNEDDACFTLPTMIVPGHDEYFFIGVGDTSYTGQPDKADDFYMQAIPGSKIKLDYSNGQITLMKENGIYRPMALSDLEMSKLKKEQDSLGDLNIINTATTISYKDL